MTQLFEPLRTVCRAVVILGVVGWGWSPAAAEEPAQRFVEQLRAAGLFQEALTYLDRLPEYPGVDPEFLRGIELERAQILLAAASRSRMADQRDANFVAASDALQSFLRNQPDSPRRSEAQLQLGNLQMVRGAQLMELGGEPDAERRGRAREAFANAVETFDAIVEQLRTKLKAMQGRKLDPEEDFEAIALRDSYRGEFLSALLMGGDARKRAAETFAEPSDAQRKWYDDALARFEELGDKYNDTLAGVRATLYAGQVLRARGEDGQASERFLTVIEAGDDGVLRPLQAEAVVGLMRIALNQSPPAYQVAIDRGQPWADDVRPDERDSREFQELRLVLAEAYMGSRETAENPGEKRRAAAAARALLRPVARSGGPFQEPAEKYLAELGLGDSGSDATELAELPESFDEALKVARELLEEEKNKALTAELTQRRVDDGEPLEEELRQAREELRAHRRRAADFVRRMLGLADEETPREDLVQARYWLAYLLLRAERYREAAVVGEFVARRYPASELGMFSGLTAVNAWQGAYGRAAPAQHEAILDRLQRVAQYVVDQWPRDPQSASAREMLVRVSIGRSELDKAQRYLADLPAENPARDELQQALATLMWNQAVQQQKAGEVDAATATRQSLIETLSATLGKASAEQVSGDTLRSALLLARAQLVNGESGAALQTLENELYGPLRRIADVPDSDAALRAEIYANALQAIVSQLTGDGADAQALLERASEAMEGLQQAYEGQPEGNQKLIQQFFRLARDIRDQMESAPPAKQQQLLTAFQLFLNRLAGKSDDAKTLHWAAQTMLGMARDQMDLQRGGAAPSTQSEQLVSSAVEILRQMETRAAEEPGWLGSDKLRTQVRLELGTAARLAGDFKTAIDTLYAVLRENQMLIDAQVEAALAYEQWAAQLPEKYATVSYGRAIGGAKPDPDSKRNVIWGWGTIARRTMPSEQFRETFFDARYHLALCRYLQGKKTSDSERSEKLIEQAKTDIRNVQIRFQDLGGGATRQRFELLLKEIQKSLGQPPNGLAEFS